MGSVGRMWMFVWVLLGVRRRSVGSLWESLRVQKESLWGSERDL